MKPDSCSQIRTRIKESFPDSLLSVLPSSGSWVVCACHSKVTSQGKRKPSWQQERVRESSGWLAAQPGDCPGRRSPAQGAGRHQRFVHGAVEVSVPRTVTAHPTLRAVTGPSFVGWEPAASLGHVWWQQNRTEGFGQNKEHGSWLMLL